MAKVYCRFFSAETATLVAMGTGTEAAFGDLAVQQFLKANHVDVKLVDPEATQPITDVDGLRIGYQQAELRPSLKSELLEELGALVAGAVRQPCEVLDCTDSPDPYEGASLLQAQERSQVPRLELVAA